MAALLLLLLPVFASGLKLTPPENIWVREGENNVTMLCVASETIRSCSWGTPYGKVYPLESGLMAEGGRMLHFARGRGQCGITITQVEARDEGKWTCNVGVVVNSEVTTASGVSSLSLALPPASLDLLDQFAMATANLSAHAQYEVVCKAGEAKPKPVFNWTLDGKPLTGLETRDEEVMVDADGLSKFSQSLIYSPDLWHANKTLACSIAHPGLPDNLKASTRILLALPPSVRAASFPVSGIIGIVVFAVLLTAIVISLVIFKCKKAAEISKEKTDPEKAESNETGLDKDSKTESATEEEEEEVAKEVKPNMQKKITAFFSSLKTKEQKKVDDTLATEWEKVDLVDEKEKGEEDEVKKEKVGLASKVSALLTKLRPEKKEEEVKEEEVKAEEVKEDEKKEEEVDEKPAVEEKPVRRGSETPV